jgi:hypothetical protein
MSTTPWRHIGEAEVYFHAFFDLGTKYRWVVSFTPRPLYPQGKRSWYPLDRRPGGPQSRSGRGGEEKNSQPPPGIESQNPDRPAVLRTLTRYSHQSAYDNQKLRGLDRSPAIVKVREIQEATMGWHVDRAPPLVRKHLGKHSLGRRKKRWEDKDRIKVDRR